MLKQFLNICLIIIILIMNCNQRIYFIFKFKIYIKEIIIKSIQQSTDLIIEWKTHQNFENAKKLCHLENGIAKIQDYFEIEEILQKNKDSDRFNPLISNLFVHIIVNDMKFYIGKLQIELSLLAQTNKLNSFQIYQLQQYQSRDAYICMSFTQISNFEILPQQVPNLFKYSTSTCCNQGKLSNKIIHNSRNNLRKNQLQKSNEQNQFTQRIFRSTSLEKRGDKNKKSKSKIKFLKLEKFIKLIQQKDEIIQQLQNKIEKLIEEKNQQKQNIGINYKQKQLKPEPIGQKKQEILNVSIIKKKNQKKQKEQKRKFDQIIGQLQIEKTCLINQNKFLKGEIEKNSQTREQLEKRIRNLEQALQKRFDNRIPEKKQLISIANIQSVKDLVNQINEIKIQKQKQRKVLKEEYTLPEKKYLSQLQDWLFQQRKKNILIEQLNDQLQRTNKLLNQQISQYRNYHNNLNIPIQYNYLLQEKIKIRENIYTNQIQKLKLKNKQLAMENTDLKRQNKQNIYGLNPIRQQRFKQIQEQLKLKIKQQNGEIHKKNLQIQQSNLRKQHEIAEFNQKIISITREKQISEKKSQLMYENLQKQRNQNIENERKIKNLERIQRKYYELQKQKQIVQNHLQKMQLEKKQKVDECNQLKYQLQQRQFQWNKLKRIEADYKKLQQNNIKLSLMNDHTQKKMVLLEKKSSVLKNSIPISEKGILNKIKQIQQQYNILGKREILLQAQTQKQKLRQQAIKLNDRIKELQKQIKKGVNYEVLQLQKKKIKQQLQNEIQAKLKVLEIKIEQNKVNRNEFDIQEKVFDRIRHVYEQNRQLKQMNKDLTKKIITIQNLKNPNPNESYIKIKQIKRKQSQRQHKQNQFLQQLQEFSYQKNQYQVVNFKGETQKYIEKLKQSYQKTISFLKKQIEQYQKKQIQLLDRQNQITLKQIQVQTITQSKRLIDIFEMPDQNQYKILKQRLKYYQDTVLPRYKQLKQKKQSTPSPQNIKISNIYTRRSQYDENLIADYQKKEKQFKIKIHNFELEIQKVKNQKQQIQKQIERQKNESKKNFTDKLNEYQRNLEQSQTYFQKGINSLAEDNNKKQSQIKQLLERMSSNEKMVMQQIQIRQNQIQQKNLQISLNKEHILQLQQIFAKTKEQNQNLLNQYTNLSRICFELKQSLKIKQQELLQLSIKFDLFKTDTENLFFDQKKKYDQLDFQYKQQNEELKNQNQIFQKKLEQEIEKQLKLEAQLAKNIEIAQQYQNSIQQIYSQQLKNQNIIIELKEYIRNQQRQRLIFQEEYQRLLTSNQNKSNEILQIKNKMKQNQQRLIFSEDYILKLQKIAEEQKNELLQMIKKISNQKQLLSNQKQSILQKLQQLQQNYENKSRQLKKIQEQFTRQRSQYRNYVNNTQSQNIDLKKKNQQLVKEIQIYKQNEINRHNDSRLKEENNESKKNKQKQKELKKKSRKNLQSQNPHSINPLKRRKSLKQSYIMDRQQIKQSNIYQRQEIDRTSLSDLKESLTKSKMNKSKKMDPISSKKSINNIQSTKKIFLNPNPPPPKYTTLNKIIDKKQQLFLIQQEKSKKQQSEKKLSQGYFSQSNSSPKNLKKKDYLKSFNIMTGMQQKQQQYSQPIVNIIPPQQYQPPTVTIIPPQSHKQIIQLTPPPQIKFKTNKQEIQQQQEANLRSFDVKHVTTEPFESQHQNMISRSQYQQFSNINYNEEDPSDSNQNSSNTLQKIEIKDLRQKIKVLQNQLGNKLNTIKKLEQSQIQLSEKYHQIREETIKLNEQIFHEKMKYQTNELEFSNKLKQLQRIIDQNMSEIIKLNERIQFLNHNCKQLQEIKLIIDKQNGQLQMQILRLSKKQQELLNQQKILQQTISQKVLIINEFQELIKQNYQEKLYYEKIIKDLSNQFSQQNLSITQKQTLINQLNMKIEKIQRQLIQQQNKNIKLCEQFEEFKQKLETIIRNLNKQVQQKYKQLQQKTLQNQDLNHNLQVIAQKYLNLQKKVSEVHQIIEEDENQLQNANIEINEYINKLNESQQKINQLCSQMYRLTKQKQIVTQKLQEYKNYNEKLKENVMKQQKKYQSLQKLHFNQMQDRNKKFTQLQLEFLIIKKDLQSFNLENKKLRCQNQEYIKQISELQNQIHQIIKLNQSQKQILTNQNINHQQKIKSLQQLINQHYNQIKELSNMEAIREKMIKDSQLKLMQAIRQKSNLIEESNMNLEMAVLELNNKHNEDIKLKNRQIENLKKSNAALVKQVQKQRIEMFNKQCIFQQQRSKLEEQKYGFINKIKKYQQEVYRLIQRFKIMQKQRSKIELFEQISFHNQILKNRVQELESQLEGKSNLNQSIIYQQFQNLKRLKLRQKQDYEIQIENYTAQINDLEQRNYELTQQIQKLKQLDVTRISQYQQENIRMQNEIIRLQHSQQQLLKQLKILKTKRQQDFKKFYGRNQKLRFN